MAITENYKKVLSNIEKKVGLPIEKIKDMNPSELREYLETKNKKRFTFTSEFPFIGRGNVLRDGIISREELNK